MSQANREDLKAIAKERVFKNNRRLVEAEKVYQVLEFIIDSCFNLIDDAGSGGQVNSDWNATSGVAEILNKPSVFPPDAHTHAISAITGLQAALDSKAAIFALANTIKGRLSTDGDVQDLTGTQVTTLLDIFTTSLKGLTPASGGGTVNYLRADGTWQNPLPSVSEVGASNTITTTSTTDVAMTSMTLTPGAGTYLAMFSCTGYNNGTPGGYIEASLYVNGTQVATSLRRNTNGGNNNASALEGVLAFQEKVTVTAGQVIDVRWRVNGATGTVIQRKLTLIPCQ